MAIDNRQQALENINKAKLLLREALTLIEEENQDGKQFDYVNSPRLSDSFDGLQRTVNNIEKIVYQQ